MPLLFIVFSLIISLLLIQHFVSINKSKKYHVLDVADDQKIVSLSLTVTVNVGDKSLSYVQLDHIKESVKDIHPEAEFLHSKGGRYSLYIFWEIPNPDVIPDFSDTEIKILKVFSEILESANIHFIWNQESTAIISSALGGALFHTASKNEIKI